jgi:hypothetical protein
MENSAMLAKPESLPVNPLFLCHDLLIELGRVAIAIDDARRHDASNDHADVTSLECRRAALNETLSRLAG